jgi:hypothetical protein
MNPESTSRILHQNLDTSFVNLWSLLRNLSQRGFVGRVRVELKDYTADVFMTGSNAPLVREIDRAAGTDTLEEAALHRLVLRAREAPGSISVYEGAEEAVAVKSSAAPEPDDVADSSEATPAPPVDTVPPALVEPAAVDPIIVTPLSVAPESVAPEPIVATTTIEAEPLLEEDESIGTIEWSEVVKISGEVIAGVERALTEGGADFATLFRATRLELADDYPFMDPLSDGFAYSNSIVTLSDADADSSYVAGLSEALRRMVDKVATGDRSRRLRERVALELALLSRKRKELLARSGFRAHLDRIAGTKVI